LEFGTAPKLFLAQQTKRVPAGTKVLCLADGQGCNGLSLDLQQADLAAWD
jgi:hypothetical protein